MGGGEGDFVHPERGVRFPTTDKTPVRPGFAKPRDLEEGDEGEQK